MHTRMRAREQGRTRTRMPGHGQARTGTHINACTRATHSLDSLNLQEHVEQRLNDILNDMCGTAG